MIIGIGITQREQLPLFEWRGLQSVESRAKTFVLEIVRKSEMAPTLYFERTVLLETFLTFLDLFVGSKSESEFSEGWIMDNKFKLFP